MYQLLLTNRYLTSRVIPLLAVAAVALCVALVITVVSVMTGFLDMVKESGRTLMGDVVVGYPVAGIPYYEDLIEVIEGKEKAAVATAAIDTWGILRMPYPDGDAKETEAVQIWGIEPGRFNDVTGFEETLHWRSTPQETRRWLTEDAVNQIATQLAGTLDSNQKIAILEEFARTDETPRADLVAEAESMTTDDWSERLRVLGRYPSILAHVLTIDQMAMIHAEEPRLGREDLVLEDGINLSRGGRPAIVPGIHVSQGNSRTMEGDYAIARDGYWWMPRYEGVLTTIPIDAGGGMTEPESVILPFANEFSSGIFLIDEKRVLVPLSTAQELTHLDEALLVDEDDPTRIIGKDPARATMILIRGTEGTTPDELLVEVKAAYEEFLVALDRNEPDHVPVPTPGINPGLYMQTWEQHQSSFIGPVEKERELMRVLFSIVYVVCAALVLAIFWSIVHEKTRDIGILRSIGASRRGIIGIFLLYGLVVGVLGALLGLLLGWLIVTNINLIHEGMGDPPMILGILLLGLGGLLAAWSLSRIRDVRMLPSVLGCMIALPLLLLGGLITWAASNDAGFVMWDPRVYYFSVIPNSVDYISAFVTMIGAVVFSLLGALIPAVRAADTDPVDALRYE